MAKERVQKIIANNSKYSRRKAEDLIDQGRVNVNDKKITIGDKADITKDKISVDEKEIKKKEKIYIILNKPIKYLVTKKDPSDKKTIFELDSLKEYKDRVFPVGRSDYLTEGLIILTNDGNFANKIAHPRYETQKIYYVSVCRDFEEKDIQKLKQGIEIGGRITKADAKIIGDKKVQIQIHEGRNRIIRKIMKELDYRISSLERIQIGKYELGDLKKGEIKKIKP